jgi:hypothetical protein
MTPVDRHGPAGRGVWELGLAQGLQRDWAVAGRLARLGCQLPVGAGQGVLDVAVLVAVDLVGLLLEEGPHEPQVGLLHHPQT